MVYEDFCGKAILKCFPSIVSNTKSAFWILRTCMASPCHGKHSPGTVACLVLWWELFRRRSRWPLVMGSLPNLPQAGIAVEETFGQ